MREVMKIMGLTDTAHRLSWFVTAFILFFWIALSSTYIVKVSFFPKTNAGLMFFVFFFFAMSEINLCFLISVFFSNSKLAAIVGPFILLITILPRYIFFSSNLYEASVQKYAACLLSPTAFTFAIDIINGYEYTGVGLQFSNLSGTDFNVLGCMQMMIADFFIYGILAWYLDQVIPHEFGTPRHPLFLFQPSYWRSVCCCFLGYPTTRRADNIATYGLPPEMITVHPDTSVLDHIELLSEDMMQRVPVIVHALRKQYPNGKVAVERIDLSMVEGQITCLLGHNGAGKTFHFSSLFVCGDDGFLFC
jgi:ABC-type multidrug transport system fused ATPase/permease subunit